jgi:hypothetical protein
MLNPVQIDYVPTSEELQEMDAALHYDAHKPYRYRLHFGKPRQWPFGNPYQWPFGLLMLVGICYRLFLTIQMLPASERLIMYLLVGVPWALIVAVFGFLVWISRRSILSESMRTNSTPGHPIRFDISEKGITIETHLTRIFAQWVYVQNVKWCPLPAGFLIKTMGGTYWMPGSAFKTPELLDQFVSLVKGAGVQFEELPTG